MIPKILHQTYKTVDNLPAIYLSCQTNARELHPDWEYKFWTDEAMYAEVKNRWPELWPAFQALPRKIMQIDVFRYCLMYMYGGLYADLDYYFIKPFDLLDMGCVLPKSHDTRLGNCILASEPYKPIWKEMILNIIDQPRNPKDFINDTMVCDGENGTGPEFVTTIYNKSENKAGIYCPDRILFFPEVDLANIKLAEVRQGQSYGFHICTGAWRHGRL
jgi:mannosyltransferase OCH1-like enzyme